MATCKDCLHLEACSRWTDFPKQCGEPTCRHFIIETQPTADVVPRAEVFKIDKEKVSDFFLKKEITTSKEPPLWEVLIMNVYDKGYADAVREIFAELEFDIAQLDYDSAETRAIAIEGIIAALKKKYTERRE